MSAHLESVLESPAFRSSQRSCQFLRYVVETTLAGSMDGLKERLLGEKIFGRPLDYDTGQDSIVRVKANEVRRRLAQYYDLHPESPIRIELPAGSYVPAIHRGHAITGEITNALPRERSARITPRWVWAAVAIVPVAVAAFAGIQRFGDSSPFLSFWTPYLNAQHELILCIPTPETYRIYGNNRRVLVDAFHPRQPGIPPAELHPDQVRGIQIVQESGEFLGLGDAHAMTLLYAFASAKGRRPEIRAGNDTTFTELRAGPSLLIGGFTNRWTLDLMKDARFAFESEGSGYGIRDRSTGKFVCRKQNPWEPAPNEDCAVVTRFPASKTGHPLLVAAGLDHFGTFAVGEFLTRPDLLEPALRDAPRNWQRRNLQIVFRTEVVRDNIGPPKVLATHIW